MNKNVGLAKSINIWNGTLFAQDLETGGFPDLPDFWLNASEYISHTIDSICLGADVLILDVPNFFEETLYSWVPLNAVKHNTIMYIVWQ